MRLISDDIRGTPCGHFVIITGYDPVHRHIIVADPFQAKKMSGSYYCEVSAHRLINTILLYGEPLHSREETRLMIFDYIEVFYNRQRLHSALGYQTPEAFALSA